MHILLTGAAGFIGRNVLRELAARGHDARLLDALPPDAAAIDGALKGIEAVLYLGGGPATAAAGTVDSILAGMARAGIKRLTLRSSAAVYGEGAGRCDIHGEVQPGRRLESELRRQNFEAPCPVCGRPVKPAPVTEDSAAAPHSAYGAAMLEREYEAAHWARVTGGSVAVLRYHNIYGPGIGGAAHAGVAGHFAAALKDGDAPRVFEDGRMRRDFIDVRDVAAATADAAEKHAQGVRAFNVASGTPRSVGDMALALAQAVKGPLPIVTGGYRPGDVRHITADPSRLTRELGWSPKVAFADGVTDMAGE